MSLEQVHAFIQEVEAGIHRSFRSVDAWFDMPEDLRSYRPQRGSWSIDEILEHISLTNHFLLILIRKGTEKALQLAEKRDIAAAAVGYSPQRDLLDAVGRLGAFPWVRPAHMEPSGAEPTAVREHMRTQQVACAQHLQQLAQGAGILYKTTMTVNGLGKIDVYEYLFFLAMHAQRHITQMEDNRREWSLLINQE